MKKQFTHVIRNLLAVAILCMLAAVAAAAQETDQTPTPTPAPAVDANAERIAAMDAEIKLINKQKDLEVAKHNLAVEQLKKFQNALKPAGEGGSGGGKNGDDKKTTTFAAGTGNASPEVTALSYQALKELSKSIEERIHPLASQYSAVVVYNGPDFDSLAKYRIYRRQATSALANYDKIKAQINALAGRKFEVRSTPVRGMAAVTSMMSMPSIATAFLGDVGQLLSMFRSQTTITQWDDTLDQASLETAMASALAKGNPNIKIFMPAAFVPEYDLDSEGKESIILRVTDINQAYQDLNNYIERAKTFPAAMLSDKEVQTVIADAKIVRDQLGALAIGGNRIGGQPPPTDGDGQGDSPPGTRTAAAKPGARQRDDLEELIRAEKLDRFLRENSHTGILKVRLIASGGSRRQTSNLLFGDHIRYSGSLTFEVLMFDIDGLVKASDIFSWHTGFRKLDTAPKP